MSEGLYVETSALLRFLLEGDPVLGRQLERHPRLVTSALTFVEAERALGRAAREGRLSLSARRQAERWLRAFERSCEIIALDDEVLTLAKRELPEEPIRSLDALHVASMLRWENALGELEVQACDDRVRRNAAALGFSVWPKEKPTRST